MRDRRLPALIEANRCTAKQQVDKCDAMWLHRATGGLVEETWIAVTPIRNLTTPVARMPMSSRTRRLGAD
jgi:hypothetical protein